MVLRRERSMWAIDVGTTNTGVARWDPEAGQPRLVALPDICRAPSSEDPLEAPLLVPSATEARAHLDFWSRLGSVGVLRRNAFLGSLGMIGAPALLANHPYPRPSFTPTFKQALATDPLKPIARHGHSALSARDIARLFLRELFRSVKQHTGSRVRDLVFTVPVDAYERYRMELSAAAEANGVRRVRFADEPVAAAVGYGLGLDRERTVLVVDFGAGTLDVALVKLSARSAQAGRSIVIGKDGAPLGGRLVDAWLVSEACRRLNIPLEWIERDQMWMSMMLDEACRVKEGLLLSETETFLAPMPVATNDPRLATPPLTISRNDLIGVLEAHELGARVDACVDRALAPLGAGASSAVDDVLLVGGSTLLPGFYKRFEERFGRAAVRAWKPFEAVVYGAAAFAGDQVAGHEDFILHDYAIRTHQVGTHEQEFVVVIPRGTRFPSAKDLWKRGMVPTCARGEPETQFKLIICELGQDHGAERTFAWDAQGGLHKVGGGSNGPRIVVPLNESSPTLGRLDPPHSPSDKAARLELAFGVDAERWLIATVRDLKSGKVILNGTPVVRLL